MGKLYKSIRKSLGSSIEQKDKVVALMLAQCQDHARAPKAVSLMPA